MANQDRDERLIKSIEGLIKSTRKENNVRKKDVGLDIDKKTLKSIEQLVSINKKQLENSKRGGLIAGLGTLLGVGGLMGYFLTGKKEFLNSFIKGFAKFSPTKFIFNALEMGIRKAGKKLISPIGSMFSTIFSGVVKIPGVAKSLDMLSGLFKPISKVLSGFVGVAGKVGASVGLKVGGKAVGTATKTGLKKIPVLGAVLGVLFGIQRFSENDYSGGLLEIASGVASLFPGIGTAISLGIDGVLLAKDTLSAFNPPEVKPYKHQKKSLSQIPVFSPIVNILKSIGNFITDPLGSMKNLTESVGTMFPGIGGVMSKATNFIDGMMNDPTVKKIKSITSPVTDSVFDFGKKIFSSAKDDAKRLGDVALKPFNMTSDEALSSVQDYTAKQIPKITSVFDNIGGFFGLRPEGDHVDIANLHPNVRHNLLNMAAEYSAKTGKTIQINSGYRTYEEQERLFDEYGAGRAAEPGRSMHNFGYAFDINSSDASSLQQHGLLDKYKFHKPFGSKEAWHIEPSNVDRATLKNTGGRSGGFGGGDATTINFQPKDIPTIKQDVANMKNIPISKIVNDAKNSVLKMSLDNSTIEKLSDMIAEKTKRNKLVLNEKYSVNFSGRA